MYNYDYSVVTYPYTDGEFLSPIPKEHFDWCTENIGLVNIKWYRERNYKSLIYHFKNEKDAFMFALRFDSQGAK